jgi:hypothetical protein
MNNKEIPGYISGYDVGDDSVRPDYGAVVVHIDSMADAMRYIRSHRYHVMDVYDSDEETLIIEYKKTTKM